MDSIKEAFQKVKKDINSLNQEISSLKINLKEVNEKITKTLEIIKKLSDKEEKLPKYTPELHLESTTQRQTIPAQQANSPTRNTPLEALNSQNLAISTGNVGVPTDRQTDRQTDRHITNDNIKEENSIQNAVEILNSLDNIKKEIRLKFKRLTEQEILVFSQLYQLDEEVGYSDYKTLSNRLNLSESSIRDYIGRLIKKGIPVEKHKIKNKNVQLSISENLKKIATLSTILRLREL